MLPIDVDELRAIYEGEDAEPIGDVRPMRPAYWQQLAAAMVRAN